MTEGEVADVFMLSDRNGVLEVSTDLPHLMCRVVGWPKCCVETVVPGSSFHVIDRDKRTVGKIQRHPLTSV